jgi:hypothetical protein
VDAASTATDPVVIALDELGRRLEITVADLLAALERVDELRQLRAAGAAWADIVAGEERPLIVERITRVLVDLGDVGGRFRRAEAIALQQEGVSLNQIGQMFGVSRQRVSMLVRTRSDDDST